MTKLVASFTPEDGFKHRFAMYPTDSVDKNVHQAFQLANELHGKGMVVTTNTTEFGEVYLRWHEIRRDKSGIPYWGNELITVTRRRKYLSNTEFTVEINWSALGAVDRKLTALFGAALSYAAKMAETLEIKELSWEVLPTELKELLTKPAI
jgi:hypothetical protein